VPFPVIFIKQIDGCEGLHEFGIEKNLPHTHPTMLNPAITEAKQQIEHFWTVIAFVRDTVIRATGEIFYEFDNQRHRVNPPKARLSNLSGVAGELWFDVNRAALTAHYDLEKVKRLNFACGILEPIGRFIALYQLLLSVCEDSQAKVESLILSIEPNSLQTVSPKDPRKFETVYTRLRNELAHHRSGTDSFKTHEEIILHLSRFEWMVKAKIRENILPL
jgi:hypothetical protein